MKSKFWIEIDSRWEGDFVAVYAHTDLDCRQSMLCATRYWQDFYYKPISNQYKLLLDANNGLDPLKCKKEDLNKLKKLLKLNKYKFKENIQYE